MTDLLRSGATLTSLSCPACSSPLFRLRNGDLWCGQCQKKVIVVKEEREADEAQQLAALSMVEETIMGKMMEINERLREADDPEELRRLSLLLSGLLENLKSIRALRGRKG
jgi:UPF0148 protein